MSKIYINDAIHKKKSIFPNISIVTITPRISNYIYINLPIGAKAAANAEFEIMINAVDENFIFVLLLTVVVDDILSSNSLLLFLLH